MEQKEEFKREEEKDPVFIELIKELLLRWGATEDDQAQKEIDRILKELEQYLTKPQIDMLLKRLRTKLTGARITDRELAEILGNFPPE